MARRIVASESFSMAPATEPAPATASAPTDEVARLKAELAQAKAELEKAQANKGESVLTLFVTDGHVSSYNGKPTSKGAISLYGLRKMPLTYYANEWAAILDVLTGKTPCAVKGQAGIRVTFGQFVDAARKAGRLSE